MLPATDYESMFEFAPMSLWLEDYSGLHRLFESWRSAGVVDLVAHLNAEPAHVRECMRWLAETLGGLQGRDVLELGPLEAAHTAALLQAGARSVLAIEANKQAFLKCLIVKELCGLRDASFMGWLRSVTT